MGGLEMVYFSDMYDIQWHARILAWLKIDDIGMVYFDNTDETKALTGKTLCLFCIVCIKYRNNNIVINGNHRIHYW